MAMPMMPVRMPPRGEVDARRPEVGEAVGRRHHVGGDVGCQRRDEQREQREQAPRRVPEPREQRDRVPDRLAEDHGGRRRHGHADEREQRHRRRQAESLAPDLRLLVAGVARQVGDVERERRPEADHGGERRHEDGQELAGRPEPARLRQHGPEPAGPQPGPGEQREAGDDQERRRPGLQRA